MVNCSVSNECGGGTKYLKKSECDTSTCCQIGGTWYFYTSKQKCNEDQKKNSGSGYNYDYSKNTNTIVTNIPIPTSSYTYSAPSQPTPTINQTAIDAANQERISRCQGDCRRTRDSNKIRIRNYYRALGGLGSSFYQQALAENDAWAQNCINSCY